jgi:hypothetical protein
VSQSCDDGRCWCSKDMRSRRCALSVVGEIKALKQRTTSRRQQFPIGLSCPWLTPVCKCRLINMDLLTPLVRYPRNTSINFRKLDVSFVSLVTITGVLAFTHLVYPLFNRKRR